MCLVNPMIIIFGSTALMAPIIAYMISKGLLPGDLVKKEFNEGLGKVRTIHKYKNSLVIETKNSNFIGLAIVDMGDVLYRNDYRTLDGLHIRARNLGRIVSLTNARVELRFHVNPVSLNKIEKKLERELQSIKAIMDTDGPTVELKDRERRISMILERIKRGETASWLTTYILVYTHGNSIEEAGEKAIKEACNIANSLNLVFGGRTYVCSSRQLKRFLNSYFLGPPRARKNLKTSNEPLILPLPPIEKETLSPNGVFLGYRSGTRIPFMIDIRKIGPRHILIIGPTGKGKTTLLSTLANRIYARRVAPILIVDPKGDMDMMLSRTINRAYISSSTKIRTLDKWIESKTIKELENALKSRLVFSEPDRALSELDEVFNTDETLFLLLNNLTDEGRTLVIGSLMRSIVEWIYANKPSDNIKKIIMIDEAWRSSEASVYYTKRMIKESRSFGLSFVLSTQSIEDLPQELLSNVGTTFVFGGLERNYLKSIAALLSMDIEEVREALSVLGVGQALVRLPDNPNVIVIDIDPDTEP